MDLCVYVAVRYDLNVLRTLTNNFFGNVLHKGYINPGHGFKPLIKSLQEKSYPGFRYPVKSRPDKKPPGQKAN